MTFLTGILKILINYKAKYHMFLMCIMSGLKEKMSRSLKKRSAADIICFDVFWGRNEHTHRKHEVMFYQQSQEPEHCLQSFILYLVTSLFLLLCCMCVLSSERSLLEFLILPCSCAAIKNIRPCSFGPFFQICKCGIVILKPDLAHTLRASID